MAGTVVTTEETYGSVKKVKFDWLSAATGAADATTTNAYNGLVIMAGFEPDSGGTQPDDNYDVTVKDADGYDILAGQGANLSHAAAVTKVASMGGVANDTLTLGVTGANAAKGGIVTLYIR